MSGKSKKASAKKSLRDFAEPTIEEDEPGSDDEILQIQRELLKSGKNKRKLAEESAKPTVEQDFMSLAPEEDEPSEDEEKPIKTGARKKGSMRKERIRAQKAAMVEEKIQEEIKLSTPSSVVYLGHLPRGFYEKNLKKYFKQFGKLLHLKVSRGKRNVPKGYAFMQFETPEVAAIVAQATNGYLLFHKRLKCMVIPHHKVHPKLWNNERQSALRGQRGELSSRGRTRYEEGKKPPVTEEDAAKRLKRYEKKEEKKKSKLAALGVEYEFPNYADSKTAAPKRKILEDEQTAEEPQASTAKPQESKEDPAASLAEDLAPPTKKTKIVKKKVVKQ